MGKSFNTGTLVNGLSTDANGNVAIGIASPTTRLTIGRVDSTNEGGQIDLCRASDNFNAWGIDVFGNTTTPSLRFIDNVASAARMVITGAGNVGIGTSSPDTLLHLSATQGALKIASTSTSGANAPYLTFFHPGNDEFRISGGDGLRFLSSGTTERMRITGSGNVGINLTGPTGRFHIYSDNTPTLSGTSPTGAFVIQSSATTAMTMGVNPNGPFNGWIQMRHGALADIAYGLMLQPLGGDVIVGTTANPYAVTNRGNIFLNGASQALYGFGIAGAARGYMYHAGTQLYFENSTSGGNLYMTATSGGVVLNSSATSWSSNSDERLKNIIGNIENAVDSLLTLRTVKHTWKSDESNKECLALIAQDVEKVFPQIVDKYTLPVKPDDTNPDETEYLGVRYTELIPVLVKAIKELKEEIDILKNK
jgi:hypothetical protein